MKKKTLQRAKTSNCSASDDEPDENDDHPSHNITPKQKKTKNKKKKKKKKRKTDRFQVLIRTFSTLHERQCGSNETKIDTNLEIRRIFRPQSRWIAMYVDSTACWNKYTLTIEPNFSKLI